MSETPPPYLGQSTPHPCPFCAERDTAAEVARLRVQLAEAEAHNADLLADVAHLRAGLTGLRRAHGDVPAECAAVITCRADGPCWCGAAEHNARIDALLTPTGPQ